LLNNKPIEITAENFFAINLQHEIDHLNGILYYDHINKENPSYIEED
jgi:peptide deformylase